MYCDGCDRAVHVFCAGTDDMPEVWYCSDCLINLDNNRLMGAGHTASVPARTRQAQQGGRRRRRGRDNDWARVWQSVWDHLNFDLDFPFDEDGASSSATRTRTQRMELNAWQRRLQVANRQGGANRFRDTAPALLDQSPPAPESQEELRAWNAFDKARELRSTTPTNRRKRRSVTASPASAHDQEATQERKLKRPRTRRNLVIDANAAESSNHALQRPGEGPSFLTSLLQEVEKQPAPVEASSPDGYQTDGQLSPPLSSPRASPPPSNHASPRPGSATPPPVALSPRPSSPTPLTSIVRPLLSPASASYSPFSPAEPNTADHHRGRQRNLRNHPSRGQSPQSPSRNMSYSTKSEIQRMVKNALAPRYRSKEVTKDEYTDINRDVSRMLYDRVGDAEGLADQAERDKWQQLAVDAVERAVSGLISDHQENSDES